MKYLLSAVILALGLTTIYLDRRIDSLLEYTQSITGNNTLAVVSLAKVIELNRDLCKSDVNAVQDLLEERIGNLERDMDDIQFLLVRKSRKK